MNETITERREGAWDPDSHAAYHVITHGPERALVDAARTVEVSEFDRDGNLIQRTVIDFDAKSEWEPAVGGGARGGFSRKYDDTGQLLNESRVWVQT